MLKDRGSADSAVCLEGIKKASVSRNGDLDLWDLVLFVIGEFSEQFFESFFVPSFFALFRTLLFLAVSVVRVTIFFPVILNHFSMIIPSHFPFRNTFSTFGIGRIHLEDLTLLFISTLFPRCLLGIQPPPSYNPEVCLTDARDGCQFKPSGCPPFIFILSFLSTFISFKHSTSGGSDGP